MYRHVPPCTVIDRKSTYWYVLSVIGRMSVRTGTYRYVPSYAKSHPVRTALYHRRVQGGTYRYVPVHTAINQMYKIPDGQVRGTDSDTSWRLALLQVPRTQRVPDPDRAPRAFDVEAASSSCRLLYRLHSEYCLDQKPAQYPCLICSQVAVSLGDTMQWHTSHTIWFRCNCRDFPESVYILPLLR